MRRPHRVTWARARLRPALGAALLSLACAPPSARHDGPPVVVATIFPVGDLTARIAGEAARVETLLPPRASVHTWEATPGQIRALDGAVGFVTVGGGLDTWMEAMGADNPALRTVRLTEGLSLLRADEDDAHEHEHASGDPHVWLDPVLVRDALVPKITELLVAILPHEETGLRARSAALTDSLTALDASIRRELGAVPGRSFVGTHEAWAYFARRYGLVSVGSIYGGPGHEPSARSLAGLVDAARDIGLRAVLAEPQMAETAARALAAEVSARVVVVDPIGGPGLDGRESYLELMRFNARAFARALDGR